LIELLFQRRVMKMRVIKLRQFKAVQPHLADRAARGARMTSTWGGNSSRPRLFDRREGGLQACAGRHPGKVPGSLRQPSVSGRKPASTAPRAPPTVPR
jgi:hypothetical protein